jgi:hypothetical protein
MPFDLAEKFIDAVENALGAALPDDYKAAMRLSNGGELEANDDDWTLYPIADTSDKKRLARSANHILIETQGCREWPNFPVHALAIANNGAGDQLVYLRNGSSFSPIVYAWCHETGKLKEVADGISQLLLS